MLTIYRRHRENCKMADHRISKQCRCPMWATGTLEGKPYRKTLKTRSFERAQQIVRKLEEGSGDQKKPEGVTVKVAIEAFMKDCGFRNLSRSTLGKYRFRHPVPLYRRASSDFSSLRYRCILQNR